MPPTKRKQWEYKQETDFSVDYMAGSVARINSVDLNKMGQDGWELCGVADISGVGSLFYFKRERIDAAE